MINTTSEWPAGWEGGCQGGRWRTEKMANNSSEASSTHRKHIQNTTSHSHWNLISSCLLPHIILFFSVLERLCIRVRPIIYLFIHTKLYHIALETMRKNFSRGTRTTILLLILLCHGNQWNKWMDGWSTGESGVSRAIHVVSQYRTDRFSVQTNSMSKAGGDW